MMKLKQRETHKEAERERELIISRLTVVRMLKAFLLFYSVNIISNLIKLHHNVKMINIQFSATQK